MKKLLALLAGTVMSFNASAGYVQYTFAPGGNISGTFIQDTDWKAIVYYDIHVTDEHVDAPFQPTPVDGNIYYAYSPAGYTGPTDFNVITMLYRPYKANLLLDFSTVGNGFTYQALYRQIVDPGQANEGFRLTKRYSGELIQSTVAADLAAELDTRGELFHRVDYIIPDTRAPIPEPASLGLFAIGALGVAGAMRRRRGG